MADLSTKARNSVTLQAEMFSRAEAEEGLSVSVLHGRTKISRSTLRGWASGETQMPAWALGELGLPDHLASLVLDPYRKCVASADGEEEALDELAFEASGYTAEYIEARRDGKLTHVERAKLKKRGQRVKAAARKVGA